MGKIIIFLIIFAIIYFIFFKKELKNKKTNGNESSDLIMCDKCKTFYPENEITHINQQNICKECYGNIK